MYSETETAWSSRITFARPLLWLTITLQALHAVRAVVPPRSELASNVLQLCFALLAVVVGLHQATSNRNPVGRRCWFAVTAAFAIWVMAQALYVYYLFVPLPAGWSVRPDDALWVLFGLPLLLAVTTTAHETDRVAWLDRAQAILFFAVLYLLVFLPSIRLAVQKAYLIQNLALTLCCLLRLPTSTLARERRFFLNLAVFLTAYLTLESVGEPLYKHGWAPGTAVDLIWSLPFTAFIVLTLRDALSPQQDGRRSHRLFQAVGTMQGLSVAAMTSLSIGVAVMLAARKPMLGGIFVAGAFLLFALRTNARERLWHYAHRQLEETVLQDALTGLGNRLQLRKCLGERLRAQDREQVFLLFVDLDRFKQINDRMGHALGDRLLIEVGQRLSLAAPANATVCRLGGDEFVVLSHARTLGEGEAAAAALLSALREPFRLGMQDLRCTASVGVVYAMPDESADDLLRTADHAMYRAKQLGRDRVQLFDAGLRAEMNSRWRMEAELRTSIERGEIEVAFQPIYSVEQASVCGFEALARWTHPTLGHVPPSDFITLAEDSGLILALGAQVLEKACAQMAAWNHAWGTSLSVSVNVSPRQFADSGLMPSLLAILEKTGLAPSLLRLEITETALLAHESLVKSTLEQARAHGIRISLDDFGTGYSSLSFLLSLPVDEVKVDRSFVSDMHRDPDREELVRTVIHLGHSLGKRVVAEGVETERDFRGLTEMGCECVQGFLIGKPLSAQGVEADLPGIAAARSLDGARLEHQSAPQAAEELGAYLPLWSAGGTSMIQ